MKLSTIICMKQWDKQGQEGSRCKLSRNLCPSVILVRLLWGAVGWDHSWPLGGSADPQPSQNLNGSTGNKGASGPGWL